MTEVVFRKDGEVRKYILNRYRYFDGPPLVRGYRIDDRWAINLSAIEQDCIVRVFTAKKGELIKPNECAIDFDQRIIATPLGTFSTTSYGIFELTDPVPIDTLNRLIDKLKVVFPDRLFAQEWGSTGCAKLLLSKPDGLWFVVKLYIKDTDSIHIADMSELYSIDKASEHLPELIKRIEE